MQKDIRETAEYKKMTPFDACAIAEGFSGEHETEQRMKAAWQFLVDTGLCWQLQGWYGRTAERLVEAGAIKKAR